MVSEAYADSFTGIAINPDLHRKKEYPLPRVPAIIGPL
jgi:hypothetical protein